MFLRTAFICVWATFVCLSANAQKSNLDAQFSNYKLVELNATSLANQIIQSSEDFPSITIEGHTIELLPAEVVSPNLKVMTSNGLVVDDLKLAKPYKGFDKDGNPVRITIGEDFIYGLIHKADNPIFIEPATNYSSTASSNSYVYYTQNDVIEKKKHTCNSVIAEELHPSMVKIAEPRRNGGDCISVHYTVSADFSYYTKYGSLTATLNQIIGVINNVNTDFDNVFADQIKFVLSGSYIADSAAADVWSSSTNSFNVLESYKNWGNTYWTDNNIQNDVSSLWTNRDFDGSTIGLAFVGATCNVNRYNVLQDYSSNAALIRVLATHELGHNFGASHDPTGTNYIMSPSVSVTDKWSDVSQTAINAKIPHLTCLSSCTADAGTPELNFEFASSTVYEELVESSQAACELPYKQLKLMAHISQHPAAPITVSVSADASSTAEAYVDYKIVTPSITFNPGKSEWQPIYVNIYEDYIEEPTESFTLNLNIVSGDATAGANMAHTVTILDVNDFVNSTCCSGGSDYAYGNHDYNANSIFRGVFKHNKSAALYAAADLINAGFTAGTIDALMLEVDSKNSTIPFSNFRIGIATTNLTSLAGVNWLQTTEYFHDDYTTKQGENVFVLNQPFEWDGTSNVYIQFCYSNTQQTSSDYLRHTVPQNLSGNELLKYKSSFQPLNCDDTSLPASNFSIALQPKITFIDNYGSLAETNQGETIQTALASQQVANLYSQSKKIVASVKNADVNAIGCTNVQIHTAGAGTMPAGFGAAKYSKKTWNIESEYDAFKEITLYFTESELNTFNTDISTLNIVASTVPFATATADNILVVQPKYTVGVGGNPQVSYSANVFGYKYFAVTDMSVACKKYNKLQDADLVINSSEHGLLLTGYDGNTYRISANGSNITVDTTAGNAKAFFPNSDLQLVSSNQRIIFKTANNNYTAISVDGTGTLVTTTLSNLPTNHIRLDDGDIQLDALGKGLIMTSVDNTCWQMYVNSNGSLSTVGLPACPE